MLRLRPNSKVPDVAKGESIDSATSDDPREIQQWVREGFNVALRLKDRSVIDFDVIDAGRRFFREHPEFSTFIVTSVRGAHFHFMNETVARKFEHGDLKSGPNAYVVYPPSVIDGAEYLLIREGELMPFPEALFPVKEQVVRKLVHDVRAYIAKIESFQGQNGSAGLVRAIARCRDAGLSEAEATVLLIEWNQTPAVNPPWPHDAIARAVTRVFKKGG